MCLLSPFKGRRYVVVLQQGGSCQKSEGGEFSFEIPPPPIRFLKIRFGHRITTLSSQNSLSPTNFAVLSVFRSYIRCESFVSAPSSPSICRKAPRVSLPILRPKSTLFLEDCSSVELNNTRVPHENCGLSNVLLCGNEVLSVEIARTIITMRLRRNTVPLYLVNTSLTP